MDSEKASFSQPSLVAIREPESALVSGTPVTTRADVAALNQRFKQLNEQRGGLRVHKAFFRCPWPCTRGQYEHYRQAALKKWVRLMDKQGWDLKSVPQVNLNQRRMATDYSGDWANVPLLDQVEVPVAAMFQKRKVERVRLEIPVVP